MSDKIPDHEIEAMFMEELKPHIQEAADKLRRETLREILDGLSDTPSGIEVSDE